jgi:ribonuclease Z
LVGLINSFSLLSHQQELHVFGPSPLQEIIEMQIKVADTRLCYPLHFHTITGAATLVDNDKIEIKCFPTQHRIECYGFSFREKKKPRKIILESAKENNIPLHFYENLKRGEDFISTSGEVIRNEWLTTEAAKGKTYAFCADTKYNEAMIEYIAGADMIYHETTYLDNLRERAAERFHSTTKQAALIAQKAHVKKLLLGHFSSKYDTLEEFEKEAREIFPNTELALEGVTYKV